MVLIFAKNLTSTFPICFNIFLLLLYLHFNILLLLSYFLYLLYTVNQFSFTHFHYCVSIFSYKHMPQCKFSLYLKKAGLASRNIVHFKKKPFYVVSVFAFIIIVYSYSAVISEPVYLNESRDGSVAGKTRRMLNTVRFNPGQRPLFLAPVSSVNTTEKRPLLAEKTTSGGGPKYSGQTEPKRTFPLDFRQKFPKVLA